MRTVCELEGRDAQEKPVQVRIAPHDGKHSGGGIDLTIGHVTVRVPSYELYQAVTIVCDSEGILAPVTRIRHVTDR